METNSVVLQSIPINCTKRYLAVKAELGQDPSCATPRQASRDIRPFLVSSSFMQQRVQAGEGQQLPIFPVNREFAFSCHTSRGEKGQGKDYLPTLLLWAKWGFLLLFYLFKSDWASNIYLIFPDLCTRKGDAGIAAAYTAGLMEGKTSPCEVPAFHRQFYQTSRESHADFTQLATKSAPQKQVKHVQQFPFRNEHVILHSHLLSKVLPIPAD